ncbi:MAG: hypothetical protein K6C94_03220 [Candidatus Gastranaerophilales bacterium]|nr:hypothetical protein [Candidatus Gastranaerophilales bacterium]
MSDVQNKKVETLEEKWQWSHWTYVGDVFDAPEHQAVLSKMKTVKERLAYKTAVMDKQKEDYLKNN